MATDRLQLVGGIGGGIKIESATVGQTIKVKAVDENGKPTEWESADFPESGGTPKGVAVGDTISQMILGTLIQGNDGTVHNNGDGMADLLSPILAECNTDQPIVIILSYGGIHVAMQSINKGYIGGVLSQVAFTGALYYQNVLTQCGVTLVVDGTYGCLSITKETEPIPLPKVTANDNGKFLQVADGAYALVALTDVSKEGA